MKAMGHPHSTDETDFLTKLNPIHSKSLFVSPIFWTPSFGIQNVGGPNHIGPSCYKGACRVNDLTWPNEGRTL